MAVAILLGLVAVAVLIAWKGVDRNRGRVEQQSVDPRHPFDH